MKKAISLALALTMLLSVFALSTAVVSAEEGQYRKVVVDFDNDLYSYDYGDEYGKGKKYIESIGQQAAVGSNAFSATTKPEAVERTYEYIEIKQWNSGSAAPVAVSFKYWTDIPAGSNFTVQVSDGTLDSEEQKLVLSDTPVEATVDLTAYAGSAGDDLQLRFNTHMTSAAAPWTFFVDDITFIYANKEALPSDTAWKMIYDYEDGEMPNVSKIGKMNSISIATKGSNSYLRIWGDYSPNSLTSYARVAMPEGFADMNPVGLRMQHIAQHGQSDNPYYFGVEIDGDVYWKKFTDKKPNFVEFNFVGETFATSDNTKSVTIAAEDIQKISAIVATFKLTYGDHGIDDIAILVSNAPAETVDAAFADGSKQTLAITDGQVTLPAADLSTGKVSLGWWVDGKLYQNGATVAATTESTITSAVVGFTQTDGGSVRIKDPTGLRFQTKVNMADYEKIAEVVTEQGGVLALTDVVGASAVTVDNEKCIKVVDADNAFHADSTDTDGIYYSSIVGIPAENYGTNISARGYMTVSYADGSSATVYTALTTVRNIRGVAQSAQADTEYYNTLTPEQKAIIDGFAAASETEDPMPTGNYVRVKHQPPDDQKDETLRFSLNGAVPADAEKFVIWLKADKELESGVVQIKLRTTENAGYATDDAVYNVAVGTEWARFEIDLTALADKTVFKSLLICVNENSYADAAVETNIYFDDIGYIMADGSEQSIHDFNALAPTNYIPPEYEYGNGGRNFYGVQAIGCVNIGEVNTSAPWSWHGEIEVMAG